MGESGQEIEYFSLEDVCRINRRIIEKFGGLFVPPLNLNNRGALEYIMAVVSTPQVELGLYPTLTEKAAALAYHIISRHVFLDGNKRTGIFVAWEFLRINGLDIRLDSSVEDLVVNVASGRAGVRELEVWLRSNLRE